MKTTLRHILATIAIATCCTVCGQTVQTSTCGTALKTSDQQRFEKAVKDFNAGKTAEALAELQKLQKRNTNNADIEFYLGMGGVRNNNALSIRKHFGKLFKICDSYPDGRAYLYQGIIRYTDEDYDGAVESLNRFFDYANQNGTPETDALYMEASNYLYWSQFLADAHNNMAPFNPRLLLGVSSKEDELMPYMTVDGKEMYYIRFIPEDEGPGYYTRQLAHKYPKLCVSRWKDTTYNEGYVLLEPFNTHESEGGVSLTADGTTLYLSAMTRGKHAYANYDIYRTRLQDGFWTPLESVGEQINGATTWEGQPCISADGQYLYFASNRPGGVGGTDIWRCRRLANGDWSRPENLGSTVNSPGHEKCPFIHADGHTLYFASDGWQGFGGYDMYFTNLDDPVAAVPTNMGLPINSEGDEICFGVTTDGQQAYYSGRHPVHGAGGKDIMIFDLFPAAQPEGMKLFQGTIRGSDGTKPACTITVGRTTTTKGVYVVDSAIGKYNVLLSLKDNNLVSIVSRGYMPYVASGSLRKNSNLLPSIITLQRIEYKKRYTVDIAAAGGKLSANERQMLDIYAQFLLDNPLIKLRIECHDDSQAKAIYDYLAAKKLRPARLQHYGGAEVLKTTFILSE